MQIRLAVGILLIALGLWVVSGRALYTSKKEVLRIGDLKAAVDEEHALPKWTGIVAVLAGGALLFTAGRRGT
jgi:hypothetical protein